VLIPTLRASLRTLRRSSPPGKSPLLSKSAQPSKPRSRLHRRMCNQHKVFRLSRTRKPLPSKMLPASPQSKILSTKPRSQLSNLSNRTQLLQHKTQLYSLLNRTQSLLPRMQRFSLSSQLLLTVKPRRQIKSSQLLYHQPSKLRLLLSQPKS